MGCDYAPAKGSRNVGSTMHVDGEVQMSLELRTSKETRVIITLQTSWGLVRDGLILSVFERRTNGIGARFRCTWHERKSSRWCEFLTLDPRPQKAGVTRQQKGKDKGGPIWQRPVWRSASISLRLTHRSEILR